jgi:hypothetical protein
MQSISFPRWALFEAHNNRASYNKGVKVKFAPILQSGLELLGYRRWKWHCELGLKQHPSFFSLILLERLQYYLKNPLATKNRTRPHGKRCATTWCASIIHLHQEVWYIRLDEDAILCLKGSNWILAVFQSLLPTLTDDRLSTEKTSRFGCPEKWPKFLKLPPLHN